jgi:hypothetical protein
MAHSQACFNATHTAFKLTGYPCRPYHPLPAALAAPENGIGGANAGLTPHMVNGVMPTHVRPCGFRRNTTASALSLGHGQKSKTNNLAGFKRASILKP